jgi:hypothetical protein
MSISYTVAAGKHHAAARKTHQTSPQPSHTPGSTGRQERASTADSVAAQAASPSAPPWGAAALASSSCSTMKRCTRHW